MCHGTMGIFICGEVAKHYVLRVPRMRALARKHREQKKRGRQFGVLVVLSRLVGWSKPSGLKA
jgi:hypothetical protein